jgi:multimeric flavodoxin WrbA
MNIMILNGALGNTPASYKKYVSDLVLQLKTKDNTVCHIELAEKELSHCTGCFKCWVQTPGQCIIADDNQDINRTIINSDFVLFASPLMMGFVTSLLKKKMDRMIPLVHPYLTIEHGEIHHLPRYQKYPLFGLLIQPGKEDQDDTLDIVTQIFARTARNIKSRLVFSETTGEPIEKIVKHMEQPSQTNFQISPFFKERQLAQVGALKSLTVFNGSPRGKLGNTPRLLQKVIDGFTSVGGNTAQTMHLFQTKKMLDFQKTFEKANSVLIGFPLYTDGMPGIVKEFIEGLQPFVKGAGNPPIAFLVQSGFPEALHSRYVEQYLISLAARLNSPYLGTLVRGGCEGTRLQPENFNRKMFAVLNTLGIQLAEKGGFEKESIAAFSSIERYPKVALPIISLLEKLPMMQMYWNTKLKKNNVFHQRFARPYGEM